LIPTATDCSPIQNSDFTNLPLSGFKNVTQLIKRFTSFTQLKAGVRKRKPLFWTFGYHLSSTDCLLSSINMCESCKDIWEFCNKFLINAAQLCIILIL